MIMISHSTLPISQGLHNYLGEFPVAIFFVISGFVLSLSKGEKLEKGELSNKKFFISRIVKLYPLHLLIIAVTIPMNWRLGKLVPWYQIMGHALLLQCWIPTHQFVSALNASTWFLSDIIFFYLTFKYLYRYIMLSNKIYLLLSTCIFMMSYIILTLTVENDYSAGYIYFFPPFRMIDFCLGIILYRFYRSEKGKNLSTYFQSFLNPILSHILDIFLIVIMIEVYYLSIQTHPNLRCAALYWIPSIMTVFYLSICDKSNSWLSILLHNKSLQWLGSISFELFICHGLSFRIIQSIFLKIYGEDIPYLGIQFLIDLVITIAMAWISNKYIVSPIYNKLENNR